MTAHPPTQPTPARGPVTAPPPDAATAASGASRPSPDCDGSRAGGTCPACSPLVAPGASGAPRPPDLPDPDPHPSDARAAGRLALILDDSRGQRVLLTSLLRRWGWGVAAHADPAAALAALSDPAVTLVICDWEMAGCTGPEFARAARVAERATPFYLILLTSKSAKEDIAQALDAGADDFVVKPVTAPELRARIEAGERLVGAQRRLAENNRVLSETLGELRRLYDAIDRDLAHARKLQRQLLGPRRRRYGQAEVATMLRSSGHVGGDLVGSYPIGDGAVGLYSFDVSGHGVASALMTARLAALLGGRADGADGGIARGRSPAEVVGRLNAVLTSDADTDLFACVTVAECDLATGAVRFVQAGQPHPLILRRDGGIATAGSGGLPVGMIPDVAWEEETLSLSPGDRLLLYSDGLSEAATPGGAQLGEEGVRDLLARHRALQGEWLLAALVDGARAHAGRFDDDVSLILFDSGTGA